MGEEILLKNIREKEWTRKEKFFVLAIIPIYFIIAGLVMQPLDTIIPGLVNLILEPDFLITDYFVIGGVGSALINAGLLTLISIITVYSMGMDMDGHTITSACLMFGFSLFGKNLMNIWTILLGVWLYARYHKTSLSRYIYVGLYGTSLSPIITQLLHIEGISSLLKLIICVFLGIIIGFVLPPLATHVHYAHKGYSLYNVGFAGGIIATVIVSILKSFGLEIQSRLIWYKGNNWTFFILLFILFFGMIVFALIIGGVDTWKAYLGILKKIGMGGTDYLISDGILPTLLNMGVNGLFGTILVMVVGGDLNGPTIGGIMAIVGFSATGKHIRNIFPVVIGVYLGGATKQWSITDPSAMLALLFSTTLAPITGEFGFLAGILAGFLHSSVATNVGIVYGGMNLYNNGFAGGLVAIFLVPVIQSIRDRRARARGGLSL
ncbi:DUF1576 domain-containing protein [bacterium 1XD42-8]|nr:DUF1576 domain-containing protein [bacterium 1XD42-8]